MKKELLFSITKKDFEIHTFRVSGGGGQRRDKTETGVRIVHKPSGAQAVSRDSRKQVQNKKIAFKRLVQSKKFQAWLKIEAAKKTGQLQDIDKTVDEMMQSENLKVEYL